MMMTCVYNLLKLVAGAIVCRDHVQLATTDNRPRPPSCSSRRDEAIDTNNAAIGVRTKPLEPPEVSPLRTRETHSPSQSAVGAAYSGHVPSSQTTIRWGRRARPPSSAAAGNRLRRCRRPTFR
ncbi:hypothetical protein DY000_02015553 [Brassica cretica]|uniref:Secreted protein n=1 Tax=Brassica cretica TaxID=69181 RepID=A0ABQ7CWC9_BRACR|nr:hypothetical protein DY000_02015553 [Brassica cretica]